MGLTSTSCYTGCLSPSCSPQSYHSPKHGMRRYSVLTLQDLLGITAGTSNLGLVVVYEATGDAQRLRNGIPSSSSLAIQTVQHKWPHGIWSEMPHLGDMCVEEGKRYRLSKEEDMQEKWRRWRAAVPGTVPTPGRLMRTKRREKSWVAHRRGLLMSCNAKSTKHVRQRLERHRFHKARYMIVNTPVRSAFRRYTLAVNACFESSSLIFQRRHSCKSEDVRFLSRP
jgi:hypothetical protein